MTANRPRRFFAFKARSLFVMIAVVACLLGFATSRVQRQRRVVVWVLENGGTVEFDWQSRGESSPPGPKWLRYLIGDELFESISSIDLSRTGVADLTPLRNLKKLRKLTLGKKVADVEAIGRINTLEELSLVYSPVTELTWLNRFPQLRKLNLHRIAAHDLSPLGDMPYLSELRLATGQTDLAPLTRISALKELMLLDTQMTDLTPLHSMTGLRYLHVSSIKVSTKDIDQLRKSLPKCEVFWGGRR